MNISVIIPTYNRKDFLKDCLLSLFVQTYPKNKYEITVVDDGSTDGTGEMVLGLKFNNLHYFYQNHKGQPEALNLGLKKAKGKIIVRIDQDCIASKNWLAELTKGFEKDKKIVGIGGEIRAFRPQNLIEKWADVFLFNPKQVIKSEKNQPPHLIGANCAFRAEAFKRVGLFDPFLKSGHDVDLSWRLHFLGYQFSYAPKAIVFHRMPKTLWQLLKKNFIYGRDRTNLLVKHRDNPRKKKKYESITQVRQLLINDLFKLLTGPKRLPNIYKQLPTKYQKEKIIYLSTPFLHSLTLLFLNLGMLYQSIKMKMGKK